MGITGLIPFLEKASSKVYLKDIRGTTVAIDSYCWLHKGVFSCAEKLVRGEDTDLFVKYCLKYVELLLSHDIKPIMVFDGRHLPAKELTERRRRESRKDSKKRAAELLREGRIDEARSHMRRCVDVTHKMALKLIKECRLRNVDCIVAPYEADAQMAWLNRAGLAEYIITEDSDLTLFGARKIIFKLDLCGVGLLVQSDKLYLAMGCREEQYTFERFRRMCILSGCDYLDSLPGIGLAKACKFILKTEETDPRRALKKIPQYLNMRNLEVDDNYIENFLIAEATFQYMFIYNPLKRKMERLQPLDDLEAMETYCRNAGTPLNDEDALELALGNLDPFTMQKLDNWHPDRASAWTNTNDKHIKRAKHKSIWLTKEAGPLEEHKKKKNTSEGYGFFFKKIEFISKTIRDGQDEGLNSRLAENEIVTMYQKEAVVRRHEDTMESSSENDLNMNVPSKRKKPNNAGDAGDDGDDENGVKDVSVESCHTTKNHFNPFAKSLNPNSPLKSPRICENGSLLKVLSPRKTQNQDDIRKIVDTKTTTTTKRCLFAAKAQRVEVKSRFFTSNVNRVTVTRSQSNEENSANENFETEINKIEELLQELKKNQSILYISPPQNKQIKSISQSQRENVMDSNESSSESLETITKEQEEEQPLSLATAIDDEPILISDTSNYGDDFVDNAIQTNLAKFNCGSQSIKRPARLSLTKPKSKGTKAKKKSTTATTTKTTTSSDQSRLSMFGFQKRPVLK